MLIIKNILHKIEIHFSCYIVLLLAILMGNFLIVVFCISLLLIHECGHFFTAYLLKWETDKIYFYPFGGIAKFSADINKPLKEELLVLIMGPISQCLGYFLIIQFDLNPTDYMLITTVHYNILLFNLLPIYPLDGGRILQCIACYFISYKRSFYFIYFISFLFMFILIYLFLVYKNYNLLFIIILLGIKMYQERKKIHYYFQRFLLERFLKKYQFKKTIIVPSEQAFKRDCSHILKIKNRYKTEQEYLDDKYYKSIL